MNGNINRLNVKKGTKQQPNNSKLFLHISADEISPLPVT